jgi:hypothetical protein
MIPCRVPEGTSVLVTTRVLEPERPVPLYAVAVIPVEVVTTPIDRGWKPSRVPSVRARFEMVPLTHLTS